MPKEKAEKLRAEIARLREGVRDIAAMAIEQNSAESWTEMQNACRHILDGHEQDMKACAECEKEDMKRASKESDPSA